MRRIDSNRIVSFLPQVMGMSYHRSVQGKNVGKIFEILPTELRLTVDEVLPDVVEAHF